MTPENMNKATRVVYKKNILLSFELIFLKFSEKKTKGSTSKK